MTLLIVKFVARCYVMSIFLWDPLGALFTCFLVEVF